MKSGNYDALMDKFYAGTASAEEILVLRTEGLLTEQDENYAGAVAEERTGKMDWEFEDFMNEVPAAKVIVMQPRSLWPKRALAAAVLIGIITTIFIFWPNHKQSNEIAGKPSEKNIDKESIVATTIDSIKTDAPLNQTGITPLIKIIKQNVAFSNQTNRKNKNKILVSIKDNGDIAAFKNDEAPQSNFEDYLVIVNGKPITNEEDALAITRESLGFVSRNLTSTVDELKPIGQIKIKL